MRTEDMRTNGSSPMVGQGLVLDETWMVRVLDPVMPLLVALRSELVDVAKAVEVEQAQRVNRAILGIDRVLGDLSELSRGGGEQVFQ